MLVFIEWLVVIFQCDRLNHQSLLEPRSMSQGYAIELCLAFFDKGVTNVIEIDVFSGHNCYA